MDSTKMKKQFFIDDVSLQRLVDPKEETRVEALKEIAATLQNNIWFARPDTDEAELSFIKLHILVRHLIIWFQLRPVKHEAAVLDLLILVFRRRDLLRQVVKHISVSRLKKEVEKIKRLVLAEESLLVKLQSISQLLCDYEESILINNRSGSFSEVSSPQLSFMSSTSNISLVSSLVERSRKSVPSPTPSTVSKFEKQEATQEIFWESLEGLNLDVFNGINAELLLRQNNADELSPPLDNVLSFISNAIEDYPAEFFLQPPKILDSLISAVDKVPIDSQVKVLKNIRSILNALKAQLESPSIVNDDQGVISVKKHVNNLLRMVSKYFQRFHDSFTLSSVAHNQATLNEIYLLLSDLASFITATQKVCEIFLNELMNSMAKVAKILRLCNSKETIGIVRLHYIIVIYTMNSLAASIDSIYSELCETNVWELEIDIALLDFPLKISHPKIYSMIKENRKDVIKEDKDLTVLLNAQKCWKPVVDLFQNWHRLTSEEIIWKGVDAISTMRIHKNIELVDLLLTAIEKSAQKFTENRELKEVAEEIFLRLISVEVPEIRQRAYAIARSKVQQRMQGDNRSHGSLCSTFGIPLTTEIVTEVLCFGFTDANEAIHDYSKIILFALLRSKLIFKTHWLEILDIITPILPLMTCIVSIHEKIGEFTFDVYHQHSGFEDHELNQAYARFLFCSHQRIRELAKVKLLERLEFSDDLVQVVPDNFCIIADQNVTNLQVPEEKVGFDTETYEELVKVLKSLDQCDSDIVQSVLLQLSVMMNSKALCLKSHDENVWVFFMASLEMNHPNNATIRKLTINILYKWVICIPSFRIYLANEPTMLKFLINTMIYFQEDSQIKLQTSWLLFLLLFSDFIVASEKSTSMPQFLSTLSCPFRFNHHWTESPFNKITAIEQLYEAIDQSGEATDVREISKNYLKFALALEWFKTPTYLIDITDEYSRYAYYKGSRCEALKINEVLQLNENDAQSIQQSDCQRILKKLCSQLDNATTVHEARHLNFQLRSLLLICFKGSIESCAETIDKTIDRLAVYSNDNKDQQKMFIGFLQIYRLILNWLKDERIVNIFNKKFIVCMIMEEIEVDEEAYFEGLKLFSCVIEMCRTRPSLMELLIKTFEQKYKVFLPSRIVESFSSRLIRENNKKWHEVGRKPTVKATLVILRNVLSIMPIHLDDVYLSKIFSTLMESTIAVYKLHHNHLKMSTPLHIHSSTLKCMLTVTETIASKVNTIELSRDCTKMISFWARDEWKKNKSLPWMIIGHLTKRKESFASFCKKFEDASNRKLFEFTIEAILSSKKISNWTSTDQNALAIVITNILEHDSLLNSISGVELPSMDLIIKIFLEINNTSALSFIIRKMVQNDIVGVVEIVIDRGIISHLLRFDSARLSTNSEVSTYQKVTETFETIAVCFNHKPLKDHVIEIVNNEAKASFIMLFCDSKRDNETVFKKFNVSAFNLMIIMMQSEIGLKRIFQTLVGSKVIDQMMLASHDNLRITNPHNELMFQLNFWLSLLDDCEKFNSPIIDILSAHVLDMTSVSCLITTPNNSGEKTKAKFGTILEKNLSSCRNAIDLIFIQVVSIFDFVYSSKFSAEYKHDLKALCFVIIRKLMKSSDRVRLLSNEIDLMSMLFEKLELSLAVMQSYRFLETTKKNGVQKCQFMIKDLCIFLKALVEWQLPLDSRDKLVKDLFKKVLKVYDWLKADSILMNCFLNFLRVVTVMEIGSKCVTEEMDGKSLMKIILDKTMELSKVPHTETNTSLMKSGLEALKTALRYVEVRMLLKNSKVFSMLEVLHPQIGNSRRTTWDDITVDWLSFFEYFSRFEDTECLPNRVSLLCRLFRLGNAKIKRRSLTIIRNFSMRSSIGFILINSEDFRHTVDTILEESSEAQEKLIILQTLLNIAATSEQLKSKLKNSPLNRKLKYQLMIMQSDSKFKSNPENLNILHLTSMLNHALYPD